MTKCQIIVTLVFRMGSLCCWILKVIFQRQLLLLVVLVAGVVPGAARAGELVNLYEFGADEMGYLSLPEKEPRGSILLVPDAFGPRGVVKQRCDLLAKLGYVTLAVDLYNGNASDRAEMADRLQRNMKSELTMQGIQAGMKLLSESPRYQTDKVIVAVWGDNFETMIEAAAGLESFRPAAISWLEPEELAGLTFIAGYQVPLQLILRQETVSDSYEAVMKRFNQLRGMDCEVSIIDRTRGFLIEPKSTPEGVEAWSALINFWEDIALGEYRAEVVKPAEVAPEEVAAGATEVEAVPRSEVTRPVSKHPRLR